MKNVEPLPPEVNVTLVYTKENITQDAVHVRYKYDGKQQYRGKNYSRMGGFRLNWKLVEDKSYYPFQYIKTKVLNGHVVTPVYGELTERFYYETEREYKFELELDNLNGLVGENDTLRIKIEVNTNNESNFENVVFLTGNK